MSSLFAQYDYNLEDLNSSSETYTSFVDTSYFGGSVSLHYFGHFSWGTCAVRFEQLNEKYDELIEQGYPVTLTGVGKDTHLNSLSNWTGDTNTPVCADSSPFDTWSGWSASQRDLFVLDQDGNLIHHQNITSGIPSDLEELIISNLNTDANDLSAKSFRLNQNYPNPFNPITTLSYELSNNTFVSIIVHDINGGIVKTLVNSQQNSGINTIQWDAKNDFGYSVSAGVYFYTVRTNEFVDTKKMIFVK